MEKQNKKMPYAALGLVFGTALGVVLTLLVGVDIYWAGTGTGMGLITGAAIDSMVKGDKE